MVYVAARIFILKFLVEKNFQEKEFLLLELKKLEKLVLLEPKLEILNMNIEKIVNFWIWYMFELDILKLNETQTW